MYDVFEYEVRKRLGGIIGWGLGAGAFALMYMAFYPSAGEQFSAINMDEIAFYKAFGTMELSSFAGYVASTVFNFLPLIMCIYAIITGTRAIAGEDADGTLEMLVTLPLRRWQLALAKGGALAVSFAAIVLGATAGALGGYFYVASQMEVPVPLLDFVPVVLNTYPVVLLIAMLSFFLGALLPSRSSASTTATVLLIGSYLGNNLLGLSTRLADLRQYLPFYYYDSSASVFDSGVAPSDIFILVAAALIFLLLGVIAFQFRNVTVGGWAFPFGGKPS